MKEVTSSYNATDIEASVQQYWSSSDTYEKTRMLHADGTAFFFVDGPPYTTGHIHIGTAWNKIIKDCILRYHRMCGKNVIARAGYDMHGLPIEVRVEQELGFSSKQDIEKFGIDAFIDKCRSFALKNMALMSEQFIRLGVWLDFDNPYQTIDPEYIEAAWWTLQKADEKGMLERGHRVVNWCPRCATAIADAEVEYWDESDPSIYVKFPVQDREDEYLVIWTTTPWTLPANVAVAVHEDITYARVRAVKGDREEILWIAEDLIEPVLRKGRYQDYTVLETRPGTEIAGIIYRSPLSSQVPVQQDIEHRVYTADFVTLENTGMVHIAPGHGWDDYLLGCEKGLPVICPVDSNGLFTEEGGVFSGLFVRTANRKVLDELGDLLIAEEMINHRYGHCWRCKTPIIFRATEQWFLKASEMRERMLEEVRDVQWYPEWAGSARFYDWVRDARDWCISRQRYWGIPIPIWLCEACGRHRVIGTIRELEEASGTTLMDPHRPYVDTIGIPCECGGTMRRVEDIFDVWFDSAVASWATLGFPRKDSAFNELWPAEFITEGQDQTRGWFYSQLGASTIAFNRSPYRSVLMHGFALDAEGRKMSKSLGNVVNPDDVIEQQGVDVLRLYVLSQNAPWDDLKFNWDGVKTVNRALNIFWNVYRFPLPYMILDGFSPTDSGGVWDGRFVCLHNADMPPEDRWILSRVHTLARQVDEAMANCQLHRATRAIISFILEDLSRWYIQLVRPRMWLEEESTEKILAYETIYHVMRQLISLLAPFTPHITEEMYQNIRLENDPESVHMQDWACGNPELIDDSLERAMNIVRSFDEAQANARQAGRRKLRWPVKECIIVTESPEVRSAIDQLNFICRERANARSVRVIEGTWDRIGWQSEPVMKAIGPDFGKMAGIVRKLIMDADAGALRADVTLGREVELSDGSETFTISERHLTFAEELPEGVYAASMQDASVYVDVTLTPELEAEGHARELIRRLQEMRRQLDLNVEDFISVDAEIDDERICDLVRGSWQEAIMEEVRALTMSIHTPDTETAKDIKWQLEKDWDVEGIAITLRISKSADK